MSIGGGTNVASPDNDASTDDALVASTHIRCSNPPKTKKRIRKRVLDELEYLKHQVQVYSVQLSALQERMLDSKSEWEGRSRRQATERAAVEQENLKLKAAVEDQLKVVEALVKIVSKRPKLAEEAFLDEWRVQRLVADPTLRVQAFHAIVDAERAKMETVFIAKRMFDLTGSTFRSDLQYDDEAEGIAFDSVMTRRMAVDYVICAQVIWQRYCVQAEFNLDNVSFKPLEQVDDDDNLGYIQLVFDYASTYGVTLYNHIACKRFIEPDRIVLVLTSILDDELCPYPPHARVARETLWVVVSKATDATCTIQFVSHGILPSKSSRVETHEPHAGYMAFAEFWMACYKNNLESMSITMDHLLLSLVDPLDTKVTLYETV
ncbi:Aste57867_16901 [Aphanomyces stellatus]|uniref:Aste57867_16901 protein n=1 Tax=Aphanomyces stellatus TaxID=120398 RepID=A0A485L6H9_9STRA|nr:hypothetical protein As57867_016843 [Aphanomyces stellatus]VFT93664.1 Aste57867_16901 [Aphanomyces stellatus]